MVREGALPASAPGLGAEPGRAAAPHLVDGGPAGGLVEPVELLLDLHGGGAAPGLPPQRRSRPPLRQLRLRLLPRPRLPALHVTPPFSPPELRSPPRRRDVRGGPQPRGACGAAGRGGARRQRSVNGGGGRERPAEGLWGPLPARVRQRRQANFAPGRGVPLSPRPPEAAVRQSAAVGGKRGGLGASSPSAPAPPPPAVPPGAALTGRAAPGGASGPQDGGGRGESRLALGDGIWLGKQQTEPLVVALRAPGWRLLVSEQ